jgi:hypothetical protein
MARIGAVTPDSQTGCEQPQWLLNGGILGCIKVSVTSVPSRVVRPECADCAFSKPRQCRGFRFVLAGNPLRYEQNALPDNSRDAMGLFIFTRAIDSVRAMKTYTSAAFSLNRNNDFVNKLPYCSIANRVQSFGTLAWINWTTPTVHEVMGGA